MLVNLNSTPSGFNNYVEGISPKDKNFLRTEVHADILHGCSQKCPGCFIPRKNLTNADHLTKLCKILESSAYTPDDVVIGPTDIFDAENFWELMDHPSMKHLYSIAALSFTSTLLQDYNTIIAKHHKIWSLYDDIDRTPDIDFKIVLDINHYLNGDIEDMCRKLELFKQGSVQFRVNYYPGIFDRISYNDLCDKTMEDFNAPVVILPGFLTDRNSRGKVSKLLPMFLDELRNQNIKPKYKQLYTMFDANFNGHGCTNYSFYNGNLYMNPFVFDGILQRTEEFKVDSLNTTNFLAENLSHATSTKECENCEYLMSCAERNVLIYMKSRNLTECVTVKEYIDASH